MSSLFALFLLIGLACASLVPSQTGVNHRESVEIALREAANAYRAQNNLPAVGCDRTVQLVAQMHAYDAVLNPGAVSGSCNAHSWGSGFTGTPYTYKACCYTSDHNNAACMWDKGKELNANFPNNIYENAYGGPVTDADSILTAWKNSPSHNDVILNKGIWANINWVSMGAGVASTTSSTSGKAFLIFSDGNDNNFEVMIDGSAVNNCAAIAAQSATPSQSTSAASNTSPSASTSAASNTSPSASTSAASNTSPSASTSAASNTSPSASTSAASNASPSASTSKPTETTPSATPSPAESVDFETCKKTCVDERKSCGKEAKKEHRGNKQGKKKAIKKCIKKKKKCRNKCKK